MCFVTVMDDDKILSLYWDRNEDAIRATDEKYGRYCHSIAFSILSSDGEAEECRNDTYMRAWESIPPHRPSLLKAYLGKITRHLALDRYDKDHAQKRSAAATVIWDEIGTALPETNAAEPSDSLALKECINAFLGELPRRIRIIFLRRYFYFCSVSEIAKSMDMSESAVKTVLFRTREKLKAELEKEGISL